MNDKAQLLRSLVIERSADARPSSGRQRRLLPAIGISLLVLLLGVGAVLWFALPWPTAQAPAVAAPSDQATPQGQAGQLAAAAPRSAGSLAASGYVVARRKAAVAAEVTGKVVELLVDEGMVVKAGKVLARLDDVLADKDYGLARARVEASDANVSAIAADLADAERILNRIQ